MKKAVFWFSQAPTLFVLISAVFIFLPSNTGNVFVAGIFLLGLSMPFYLIFLPAHIWNVRNMVIRKMYYNQFERFALITSIVTGPVGILLAITVFGIG